MGFEAHAVRFHNRECAYVGLSLSFYDEKGDLHSHNEFFVATHMTTSDLEQKIDEMIKFSGNNKHILSIRCVRETEVTIDNTDDIVLDNVN
jgi:hypothetical protein